jgi:hypothetical protein
MFGSCGNWLGARRTLQGKRVALINAMRGYLQQKGQRLPEKFFQRRDWQRLKVSEATRQILSSSIEALGRSEAELTERILRIEDPYIL